VVGGDGIGLLDIEEIVDNGNEEMIDMLSEGTEGEEQEGEGEVGCWWRDMGEE
jgi:hypothetical protein